MRKANLSGRPSGKGNTIIDMNASGTGVASVTTLFTALVIKWSRKRKTPKLRRIRAFQRFFDAIGSMLSILPLEQRDALTISVRRCLSSTC